MPLHPFLLPNPCPLCLADVLSNAIGSRSVSLTPTVLVTADRRLAQPTFKTTDTATVALANFVKGKDIKLALTSDCTLTTPLASSKNAALVYSGKFEDTGLGGNQMLIDVRAGSTHREPSSSWFTGPSYPYKDIDG